MISLTDILVAARQECVRLRHHFLGVEHMYIALLDIPGGLASTSLKQFGVAPEPVIEAIRRHTGKGGKHILWAGIPNSPRLEVVLGIAQDLALDRGSEVITELDLLTAILDENDNVPVRVLASFGITVDNLREQMPQQNYQPASQIVLVRIDFSEAFVGSLDPDDVYLFRKLFMDCESITIYSQIHSHTSSSKLFGVHTHLTGSAQHGSYIVRIDDANEILDEWLYYEKKLVNHLTWYTAKPDLRPVLYSDRAAIRYQISQDEMIKLQTLADLLNDQPMTNLGDWLREYLNPSISGSWWTTGVEKNFEAWREYDWMLPPILVVKHLDVDEMKSDMHVLSDPIHRSRLAAMRPGDRVSIVNFTVQKVDYANRSLILALAQGEHAIHPYRIQVINVDYTQHVFFRGEIIERIAGVVKYTRDDLIDQMLRSLEPDFEVDSDMIEIDGLRVPNPAQAFQWLLGTTFSGHEGIVHGNMSMVNLLFTPERTAYLIDYTNSRRGHTAFDWAYLLADIFANRIALHLPNNWVAIRGTLACLWNPTIQEHGTLRPRTIISELTSMLRQTRLVNANMREFYIAMAFICLRAVCNVDLPQHIRRVQFLLAAYAFMKYEEQRGT